MSAAPSPPAVVLYSAPACHLCDRARVVITALRDEVEFSLTEIDITGDEELEARYREWLPVVEIDGRRAFVYYVDREQLRQKLAAQSQA
ncbi:MAG: glutaredoxin family protein [Actinomycetota bacterium]|nr:glutaredoxin family protein [Actinomycetota bacterium]